jgi:hypothetical protein
MQPEPARQKWWKLGSDERKTRTKVKQERPCGFYHGQICKRRFQGLSETCMRHIAHFCLVFAKDLRVN